MGPLCSYAGMSGESTVWRNLVEEWGGIERWIEWDCDNLFQWTSNDRYGEKLDVKWNSRECVYESEVSKYRACDVVASPMDDVDATRATVFFGVNGVSIAPGVNNRREWKKLEVTQGPDTGSQMRWRKEGFDWRERWRCCLRKRIPSRVKAWVLDLLNNNLRVCYHKADALCALCGTVVHGRHYSGECGGLTVMKAYCARLGEKVEEEELWWLVWLWACGSKKEEAVRRLVRLRRAELS